MDRLVESVFVAVLFGVIWAVLGYAAMWAVCRERRRPATRFVVIAVGALLGSLVSAVKLPAIRREMEPMLSAASVALLTGFLPAAIVTRFGIARHCSKRCFSLRSCLELIAWCAIALVLVQFVVQSEAGFLGATGWTVISWMAVLSATQAAAVALVLYDVFHATAMGNSHGLRRFARLRLSMAAGFSAVLRPDHSRANHENRSHDSPLDRWGSESETHSAARGRSASIHLKFAPHGAA